MNNLGVEGERMAKEFLVKNKYNILETNYSTQYGEIDIIAKYKKTIVFVEVKHRHTTQFGLPRESVTTYKQNKIRQVALAYLQSNNCLNSPIRFDVIDILGTEITHITDAF